MAEQLVELYEAACAVVGEFALEEWFAAGRVGAAIKSKSGRIYTGICFDVACGMGFCAEHAAIAEMLKHRETEIYAVVAVDKAHRVLPPCGRCRELMLQINAGNCEALIAVSAELTLPLAELIPHHWLCARRPPR